MDLIKRAKITIVAVLAFGLAAQAESSLTIYNQNFAVVRESLALDLRQGTNEVSVTQITAHLEPDSVILRDPQGKRALQILEQNYRADPVSQGLLLSLYEGKEIDFLVQRGEGKEEIVRGKIVRSGYEPHQSGMQRYGSQYAQTQMARSSYESGGQPIIEVDGKLRFSLPGQPLFPVPGGRHDPEADDPLGPGDERARQARRGAQLHHRRHELGGGLQHARPDQGRGHRRDRLGHDGQPERQDLRERPHQAHGRRRQQDPAGSLWARWIRLRRPRDRAAPCRPPCPRRPSRSTISTP